MTRHNPISETPENEIYNENSYSNKIILVDKPLGLTSADVVYRLKRKLKLKKVGHAGTLDPRATGLLIVCTDKMTKSVNEFMELEKEYEGTIRIGARTESFDTETSEFDIKDVSHITHEEILKARDYFLGEIEQTPPMYSALKHKGKPLYKLARKGKTIERKPRKVLIKEFEIKRINDLHVWFKIVCSKGTYIRTIANDFGERLGVGGYLKTLKRTRIGDYDLENLNLDIDGLRYRVL
ncbi:MAG: tRNA pseudouridine(55) synthase TruB [Bacteroidetes bacterium]|nr:tRNA pseudouridine(55) synthase TruB [Bacteroidota bacterium]